MAYGDDSYTGPGNQVPDDYTGGTGVTDPAQQTGNSRPSTDQESATHMAAAYGPSRFGNDYRAWFQALTGMQSPDSATLVSLKPILEQWGVKLENANAKGVTAKIVLPDGSKVRVGDNFDSDPSENRAKGWGWVPQGGGESGGGSPGGIGAPGDSRVDTIYDVGGDMGDWFSQNSPTAEPYASPQRPAYLAEPFQPREWTEKFELPSMSALEADPGYQARLKYGTLARERGAAAQGSILSGGHQKALERFGQEHASNEYGQVVGRAFDTYQQRYGQFQDQENARFGARALNESAFGADTANALNQYNQRYQAYRDTIGDQFELGRMGLNAALGSRV